MGRKTGGFFFARPHSRSGTYADSDAFSAQAGATVHDVYAGLAMHALLSANPERRFNSREIVEEAMLIADRMIAERAK